MCQFNVGQFCYVCRSKNVLLMPGRNLNDGSLITLSFITQLFCNRREFYYIFIKSRAIQLIKLLTEMFFVFQNINS